MFKEGSRHEAKIVFRGQFIGQRTYVDVIESSRRDQDVNS